MLMTTICFTKNRTTQGTFTTCVLKPTTFCTRSGCYITLQTETEYFGYTEMVVISLTSFTDFCLIGMIFILTNAMNTYSVLFIKSLIKTMLQEQFFLSNVITLYSLSICLGFLVASPLSPFVHSIYLQLRLLR